MTVPYSFGTATSAIPLSQLDSNFNTPITLGNTAIQLGNTVTTLNNMTLANVTISSGNVTLTNVSVTTANVATANIATSIITSSETLSYGTANGVAYLNGSKVVTTGSALTFDGTNLGVLAGSVTSPAAKIHAVGSVRASTGAGTVYSQLASDGVYSTGTDLYLFAPTGYSNIFYANNSEGMRLTSTGLGIGTSSPLSILTLLQSADGYDKGISITRAGANRGTIFLNASNDTLNFGRSTSTLMTLDLSGNLGLGVTPSAWSQGRAIEVGGNGYGLWYGSGSPSSTYLLNNAYFNSGFKYGGAGQAAHYYQYQGAHVWSTAASGNAGDPISFTQAMTLDASGNLVVGGTAAINTAANRGNMTINGTSSAILVLGTGGTERGFIYTQGTDIIANASTGAFTVQTAGANPVIFGANGTERARIDSSGNLLVGTTSNPGSVKFKVSGNGQVDNTGSSTSTGFEIDVGANNTTQKALQVYSSAAGADRLYIYSNGNVVNTNNSYGAISDIKLKENVVDATPKLENLMQVRVVNYNLKSDPEHKQLGVIAQELEQVFPGMVDESSDIDSEGNDLGTTTKSVKYSVFVPMLIKAIQEQQNLIVSMREELDALKAKVGA